MHITYAVTIPNRQIKTWHRDGTITTCEYIGFHRFVLTEYTLGMQHNPSVAFTESITTAALWMKYELSPTR